MATFQKTKIAKGKKSYSKNITCITLLEIAKQWAITYLIWTGLGRRSLENGLNFKCELLWNPLHLKPIKPSPKWPDVNWSRNSWLAKNRRSKHQFSHLATKDRLSFRWYSVRSNGISLALTPGVEQEVDFRGVFQSLRVQRCGCIFPGFSNLKLSRCWFGQWKEKV